MPCVKSLQKLCTLACGLVLVGCSAPPTPEAVKKKEEPAPAKAEPAPTPPPTAPTGVAGPPAAELTLARVREDVPLPLASLLGQPVATVQARLGEHQGKGMVRSSCVRFVPERVFFACTFALQRYVDPTGTFAGVRVEYEDGVATAVAFDGWRKGSGPFDPNQLVAAVGLELPEPPRTDAPAADVRRWTWFNDRARLKIDGRQYRVEVTVVGDDWARSRIDVLLNDPLTEAQKAKLLKPGGDKSGPEDMSPGP